MTPGIAGVPTKANAVDLVSRFDIDEAPERLADKKESVTREHLAQRAFPLMPGVLETVRHFHAIGLELAVVTGASANGVHATMARHELGRYFSVIVSGDEVRLSKPAPDCYLLALHRFGVTAADCVAIEDTQHGIEAASEAGIRCLAVPTEYSAHHDFHRATAVLGSMTDARVYVDRLRDARR